MNEEQELAATKQTVEDQKRAERLKEVEDEDIEMLVSLIVVLQTNADKMDADAADRPHQGERTRPIRARRQ